MFLLPLVATSGVCGTAGSDGLTFWLGLVVGFFLLYSVPVPPAFWGQLLTWLCHNMKVYSRFA